MKKHVFKATCCLLLAVLLAVAALAGCSTKVTPTTQPEVPVTTPAPTPEPDADTTPESEATPAPDDDEATDVGEGETVFPFEVVDADGNKTRFNVHTGADNVGDALLAAELIEGEDGQYGFFVTSVIGIRADYTLDGYWWCFQVDGEDSLVGVSGTAIKAGEVYAFVCTPA